MPLLGLGTWPLNDAAAVPAALARGYRLVGAAARCGNEAGVGRGLAAPGLDDGDLFPIRRQQGLSAIPKSANRRRQRENAPIFDFALEAGKVATLADLDVGEAVARRRHARALPRHAGPGARSP